MNSPKSNKTLSEQIINAIQSVVGTGVVSLHEPSFKGNELLYLKDCVDSTFVSSVGKYVDKFERGIECYTGAKHAVSVVNGTAALHVALKIAGVLAGDEVIVPAFTFVATANAITYCNATPHFVDSEEKTLGIDARKLRLYLEEIASMKTGLCTNTATGAIIRAIVVMHTFGHPSNLDEIKGIAFDYNLVLIEDAAESLGSFYKNKHTGTYGELGTFSFNGNKTITTGGGGAIITNNTKLAKLAKHLTTTAKIEHQWEFYHDMVGFNYRMPNINAALGCAQLEQLEEKLDSKRRLFEMYRKAFTHVTGIKLFSEPDNAQSNYWLNALLLPKGEESKRDEILKDLNVIGIKARPAWQLINTLPSFRDCPAMELNSSISITRRLINIPSSPGLV
jgi:perosamine synthetase